MNIRGPLHWALAVGSAVLYVLAFPKFNLSYLAWIALAPLAYAACDLKPGKAFTLGWVAGLIAHLGLLYWLVVTFSAAHLSPFLGVLCLILLATYLGLFWGMWSWFVSLTNGSSPHIAALSWAAAWVALEYLRTHLFSGFPWALLGDTQWKQLSLIQIASLTGVYGVSFIAALMSSTIAASIPQTPGERTGSAAWSPLKASALTLAVLAAAYTYGAVRLRAYAMEPRVMAYKVALLQGSIDQYQKWEAAYEASIKQTYEGLVDEAIKGKPTLIVWPETSVPGFLLQDPVLREWLSQLIRRSGTAHVVGAPSKEDPNAVYNSAFSINTEDQIIGQYDKQHLVPFGEVVPFKRILGQWIGVLNQLGGFTAGQRSPVIESPIGKIGVNICYEAIFPNLVRKAVKGGAGVIVNLTNDGWYMQTAAPYQHFIPNIFRAIENDRDLIRVNNTGVTAFVSPIGQVVAATPIFVPKFIEGTVSSRSRLTFYTRFGDIFAIVCILLCLAVLPRAILRRR
jgi:apolipoprotein N-acyltransferase